MFHLAAGEVMTQQSPRYQTSSQLKILNVKLVLFHPIRSSDADSLVMVAPKLFIL